jgi:hypothetical protein
LIAEIGYIHLNKVIMMKRLYWFAAPIVIASAFTGCDDGKGTKIEIGFPKGVEGFHPPPGMGGGPVADSKSKEHAAKDGEKKTDDKPAAAESAPKGDDKPAAAESAPKGDDKPAAPKGDDKPATTESAPKSDDKPAEKDAAPKN